MEIDLLFAAAACALMLRNIFGRKGSVSDPVERPNDGMGTSS
jgi:hypothetical protein